MAYSPAFEGAGGQTSHSHPLVSETHKLLPTAQESETTLSIYIYTCGRHYLVCLALRLGGTLSKRYQKNESQAVRFTSIQWPYFSAENNRE